MISSFMTLVLLVTPAAEKVTAQIDFRGIPAKAAFDKLSEALHERIIIARSVDPSVLESDLRLQIQHLDPDQAVRWVARLVGLEAVKTGEGYYVASAAQLRQTGTPLEGTQRVMIARAGDPARGAESGHEAGLPPEIRDLLAKSGAIFWQDTPVTRAAADVARVFEIDLIVHPAVAEREKLLVLELPQVQLARICRLLVDEFQADLEYRDGALWLHPPAKPEAKEASPTSAPAVAQDHAATRPAPVLSTQPEPPDQATLASEVESAPPTSQPSENRPAAASQPSMALPAIPSTTSAPAAGPSEPSVTAVVASPESAPAAAPPAAPAPVIVRSGIPGHLLVDRSIRDWSTFARHLETATGWSVQVEGEDRAFEALDIDGPAEQVLEALKLMGKLDFTINAGSESKGRVIRIETLQRR